MTAVAGFELAEPYLNEVRAVLRRHVPRSEVWAYESRVTGGAVEASDLDLVTRHPVDVHQPCENLLELREAFVESNLPIRVHVLDWARILDAFRREIERAHVVVQTARRERTSKLDAAIAANLKEMGYGG